MHTPACWSWWWWWKSLSRVWLFVAWWTMQSMEFSRPDIGMGSLFLLWGIFPTQGSNPGLLHCRWILYQLSQKGSPRILEWVAYPFSSGSCWPRNRTGVSCIAGRFFTNWAMRDQCEPPNLSLWPAITDPSLSWVVGLDNRGLSCPGQYCDFG